MIMILLGLGLTSNFFRFDSLTYFFDFDYLDSILDSCIVDCTLFYCLPCILYMSLLVTNPSIRVVYSLFEWRLEGRRLEKMCDIVHWKVWWGTSISRVLYCQYASVPHHTLPKERLTPKHRFRRLSVLRGAEKRITTTTTCEFYLHVY